MHEILLPRVNYLNDEDIVFPNNKLYLYILTKIGSQQQLIGLLWMISSYVHMNR